MADPPGSKKVAPPRGHTLAHGKKLQWEKGKHTWLALYWADPVAHALKPAGSGHAVLTLKPLAGSAVTQTHYDLPYVGISIEKRGGSLENNTGETIRYTLI